MKYNTGLVRASQQQGRALSPRGPLEFVSLGGDPSTQPGPLGSQRSHPVFASPGARLWSLAGRCRQRAVPRVTTGVRCGTKNAPRAPSYWRGLLLGVMTVTFTSRLFSNSSPGFKRHCYELTRIKDSADEARVSDPLGLFSNCFLTQFFPLWDWVSFASRKRLAFYVAKTSSKNDIRGRNVAAACSISPSNTFAKRDITLFSPSTSIGSRCQPPRGTAKIGLLVKSRTHG